MTDAEATAYLKAAAGRGYKLGLSRVTELTKRLGDPQTKMQIIHISGTNGKGSVGAMLAAVLQAAGYKTGHFASPALCSPHEYFRINGKAASPEQFAETVAAVHDQAEQMDDLPTEFEIIAAAAFRIFAKEQCEFAVIECCMGGDTDCTNVITAPLLSVITNVRKDHCAYLGNTLPEIAAHKAGIIKQDCPVLTGCRNKAVLKVIRDTAKKLHAPVYQPDEALEIINMTPEGTDCISREYGSLRLGLSGAYQPENAALVLKGVTLLRQQGIAIPEQAVRQGLAECRWQARMEVLRKTPYVIFDGAHNPDGMQKAAETLTHCFGAERSLTFVIGVMADKDYRQYPAMLLPLAKSIYTVTPDSPRALDAQTLADVFTSAGIPAHACKSVEEAVRAALGTGSSVIGLGSLYYYCAFRNAAEKIIKEGF